MAKRPSANEERLSDTLIDLGGRVRIERGPKLKEAKATEQLLSNTVTAEHYQLGARDAKGRVIERDKPMSYLDWIGEQTWYIYALREEQAVDAVGNAMTDERGNPQMQERWVEVDTVDGDEDEALQRARSVLDSEG